MSDDPRVFANLGLYSVRMMGLSSLVGLVGLVSCFFHNWVAHGLQGAMLAVVAYQAWVFFWRIEPAMLKDMQDWEDDRPAREERAHIAAIAKQERDREDYRAGIARAVISDPRGLAPSIQRHEDPGP